MTRDAGRAGHSARLRLAKLEGHASHAEGPTLTPGVAVPTFRSPIPTFPHEVSMATQPVSDSSFDADVLKADGPVVVDFWAEWCGPCKMIAPALEEIAKELGAKVKVVKINIDDNPKTPSQYGVRGIPTLMLFKGGKVASTKVGAAPKGQLQSWIEQSIA
jgi:thioredoxin 1